MILLNHSKQVATKITRQQFTFTPSRTPLEGKIGHLCKQRLSRRLPQAS